MTTPDPSLLQSKEEAPMNPPALSPPPRGSDLVDCLTCGARGISRSYAYPSQHWVYDEEKGVNELCGPVSAPVAEEEEPAPSPEEPRCLVFMVGAGRCGRPRCHDGLCEPNRQEYAAAVAHVEQRQAEGRSVFAPDLPAPVEQPGQVEAGERCKTCGHDHIGYGSRREQCSEVYYNDYGQPDTACACQKFDPPVPSSGAGVHGPWQRDGSGLNPRWWRVRQSGQHEHVYVPVEVEAAIRAPLEARNETQRRTIQSYRARAQAAEEQLAAVTAERDEALDAIQEAFKDIKDGWKDSAAGRLRKFLRPPSTESMDQLEGE